MRFAPDRPLAELRPAPYNPRALDAEGRRALEHSIATFGLCKPLLVAGDGTVVAGHQRLAAARSVGLEAGPVIELGELSQDEERAFNQLHNSADTDEHQGDVRVPRGHALGWGGVAGAMVQGSARRPGAQRRATMCELALRHGPWLSAVATLSGAVVGSPDAALVARQLRLPLRVYRVPDALEGSAREALSRPYGVFSYAHLPRAPWVQTRAQMRRLRGKVHEHESALYERMVLPELRPGERLLDFGCGQGDYLSRLRAGGVAAWGIEPYARSGHALDLARSRALVDEALAELEAHGPFDVVVCDAVLNSVDRPEAEHDVLLSLVALCRPGGRIYVSGRRREKELLWQRATIAAEKRSMPSRLKHFDEHGFSAMPREGAWFFQRFHTDGEVRELARLLGGPEAIVRRHGKSAWQLAAVRQPGGAHPEALEQALARELSLPWPDGESLGRGDVAVRTWRRWAT